MLGEDKLCIFFKSLSGEDIIGEQELTMNLSGVYNTGLSSRWWSLDLGSDCPYGNERTDLRYQ